MARNGRIHIFKNLVSEIKTFAVVVVVVVVALFRSLHSVFTLLDKPKLFLGDISQLHFFFESSLQRIPVTCDETSEKKNKQKNKQTRGRRLVVRAFPLNLRKTNALV